jgi:hypothetical protein
LSQEAPGQVRCTPTDPSIEFDLLEVVRVRLVESLTADGYELIEAERVALYVVGGSRQVSKFLKITTGSQPPHMRKCAKPWRAC